MDFNITLLPGDGIGPEVIDSAVAVLNAVERRFGHNFHLHSAPIGGSAIDLTGVPLPEETLKDCKSADAVLLGAVGGPKWDDLKPHNRPERGLLTLRSELKVFASLCPVVMYEELGASSALKSSVAKSKANIMLVREIAGGIYTGEHGYRDGALGQEAYDTEVYSINEVERIAKVAFELAESRNRRVLCVDKADMLTSGRLWQATVERVAKNYNFMHYEHALAGNAALRILTNPAEFDVILANNLFGDILASVLAALPGSIGMLPSAAIGGIVGLYEPVHGAANALAGRDEANPIGAILSAAMLLTSSLNLDKEAAAVENAVKKTLAKGLRTKDIAGGKKYVSCSRITEEIALDVLCSK